MATPRIARAIALEAELRAILDGDDLSKVTVTRNALEVPSGARYGVIVVAPPAITFDTWDESTPEWELHVIAGPADNYLHAWEVLDGILDALERGHLNMKRAEAGAYQPLRGEPLPAYTITLNPLD